MRTVSIFLLSFMDDTLSVWALISHLHRLTTHDFGISTLLFSSWINLVLFVAQIILSLLFLRRSRGCTLHQGLVVIGALVADTVCTVAVCANTLLVRIGRSIISGAPHVMSVYSHLPKHR